MFSECLYASVPAAAPLMVGKRLAAVSWIFSPKGSVS